MTQEPPFNASNPRLQVAQRLYPEMSAGGYTRNDGFMEFFLRVRSLLTPDSTVLDFGAGRGEWEDSDLSPMHKEIRTWQGLVKRVIGVDVDPVVMENPGLHEAHVIEPGGPLPFDSATFDVVVADHVLEHVSREDAPAVAAELARVIKPGGWFAARTPNRRGIISVAARAVPNHLHVAVLKKLQPDRLAVDVFPTRYAMNTKRDLRELFPEDEWNLITYGFAGSQQYGGGSAAAWRAGALLDRLTPPAFLPAIIIFAQRK